MEASWIIALASILFGIGAYGAVTHRSAIRILISLELMFNAEILLLALISSFVNPLEGLISTLLILALTGSEVGIVISIIVFYYRIFRSVEVEVKG